MYKTLLIPTDGSEFCERAIKHGIALAKAANAKVVGLTVIAPLHTATPGFMIPGNIKAMLKEETERVASERLAAFEAAAKAAGVAFETHRKTADEPWQCIVDAAKEYGCDLIVMASHGRRGITGVVLGSETQKVLVHSKVPVLVVR